MEDLVEVSHLEKKLLQSNDIKSQYKNERVIQNETLQQKSIQQEIQIMRKMQRNVQQIRNQLKSLAKQEQLTNKRIEATYSESLKKIEGRINKYNAIKEKKAHLSVLHQENQIRKNKIKTIRMEERQKLRAAKNEVTKCKENEYCMIRQISQNCDKKMKQYKNEEVEKKKELVQKVKNQRINYIDSVHQSRVMKQKELNQSKFQKSLEKVSVLPHLKKEIESLSKEKRQLEQRLNKKRSFNQKVFNAKLHINQISDNEIQYLLKQVKAKPKCVKDKKANRSLNQSQVKQKILQQLIIGKENEGQNTNKLGNKQIQQPKFDSNAQQIGVINQ